MTRPRAILGAVLVLGLLATSEGAEAPVASDLTVRPDVAEVGMLHGTTRVSVSTAVPPGARAIVRLIGPAERLRVHVKSRVGGVLWAKTGERTYERVPAVMLLHGWPEDASTEDVRTHRLGWQALARDLLPAEADRSDRQGFRELIQMKVAAGLYARSGSHGATDDGRALVSFEVPPDAPPGTYAVTVHVLNGDVVIQRSERHVVLRRSEVVSAVQRLARDRDGLYALLAVLMAVGVGVIAGLSLGLGSRVQ